MHFIRLTALLCLGLIMTGCSNYKDEMVNDVEEAFNEYRGNPDQYRKADLLSAYLDVENVQREASAFETDESLNNRRDRWQRLRTDVQLSLIDNKQWKAISTLTRARYHIVDEALRVIHTQYEGDDPRLLKISGEYAQSIGDVYGAYQRLAKAGLADKDYAFLPRGLAYHYGCGDLYRIWGELSDSRNYYEGESIPLSEPSISRTQLIDARLALRKGNLPEIPGECPFSESS